MAPAGLLAPLSRRTLIPLAVLGAMLSLPMLAAGSGFTDTGNTSHLSLITHHLFSAPPGTWVGRERGEP